MDHYRSAVQVKGELGAKPRGDLLSLAGMCEQQDVKVRGPVMMRVGDSETGCKNSSSVECGAGPLPLLVQPFRCGPHSEFSITWVRLTSHALRMECARRRECDEYGGITALARDCLQATEPDHYLRAATAGSGTRGS